MSTTHRHAGDDYVFPDGSTNPAKCVDIGPHVCLQPFDHSNAPTGVVLNTPEADAYGDHLGGFIFGHDRPGFDVRCEGAVNVCGHGDGRASWSMAGSLEDGDLTLSPSILCRLGNVANEPCGFHGFVRDGEVGASVSTTDPLDSPFGLGALQSPPDDRDYQAAELYAALALEPAAAFPDAYIVPERPPILNQGSLPQCVAYSSAAMKAWQDRHDGRGFLDFDEARFFAAIGGTSAGAYVRDAMAELVVDGYPEQGGANAARHRVQAYYVIPKTADGLRSAILAFGAVVIATPWYSSWFRPTSGGVLPAPDRQVGGHAILAVGWDVFGLRLRNSWGTAWGIGGECTLPWRYVAGLWEAWKALDVPPPPITHRVLIAHGATVRIYRLDTAGRIRDWTDQTWDPPASSAPCGPEIRRLTVDGRSSAITVRVIRGSFAGKVIAAHTKGVTVVEQGGTI